MGRVLLIVLSLGFASYSFAQSQGYPQRCYYSGTYDLGLFNKTTWNMWVKDKFGGGDLSGFVANSFIRITDIPPHLFQSGGELERLLKLRVIAVARFLLSAPNAPVSVMVLNKHSFQFLKENSDLSSFMILTYPFGDDNPLLAELTSQNPNNLLLSTIVGPIEISDAVCNW